MTERKWLECTDPTPMLEFLEGKVSVRKLRLFAVACCRRIWHLLTDERSRCLVGKVEQYADGLITSGDFSNAWDNHQEALSTYDFKSPWYAAMASFSDFELTAREASHAASCERWWDGIPEDDSIIPVIDSAGRHVETEAQCQLLRDIFGNPFRPVAINPDWLNWNDGAIPRLASAIYEQRSQPDGTFDVTRMGVLADALEDAGCDNGDILNHCRERSIHVRGCWLVDLLLGKQ